jgi:hypothetical protein
MNFTNVKDVVCRHCGAVNVGESWWGLNPAQVRMEKREFACGSISIWHHEGKTTEPRESIGCPQNPARIEAMQRGQAALEQLRNVIAQHILDLPEPLRQNICGALNAAAKDLDHSL